MKKLSSITIPVAVTGTTGAYLGRLDRGGITFPRAYTIIAAQINAKFDVTTTNLKFRALLYKNKTTTIGKFINGSVVKQCTTTGFKYVSIAALTAPSISTSNRLWLDITNHRANQTKISLTLHIQEA